MIPKSVTFLPKDRVKILRVSRVKVEYSAVRVHGLQLQCYAVRSSSGFRLHDPSGLRLVTAVFFLSVPSIFLCISTSTALTGSREY